MPTLHSFLLFAAAALVLLVVPGPSVLYVVARSVDQGRAAGLVSVLGNAAGNLLLVLGAVAGLSAVLYSSAAAFAVVKYCGAAYLGYLGVRRLLRRDAQGDVASGQRGTLGQSFVQGLGVAALNPKTALFFLAFVPQFVVPAQADGTRQLLVFGLTFVAMAICTDSIYALGAGALGDWLKRRDVRRGQRYFSGAMYLALGAVAALAGVARR